MRILVVGFLHEIHADQRAEGKADQRTAAAVIEFSRKTHGNALHTAFDRVETAAMMPDEALASATRFRLRANQPAALGDRLCKIWTRVFWPAAHAVKHHRDGLWAQ